MSVSSTTRKQTFSGGQSTHTFTFRALTSTPTDIKVKKTLISTGVETALAYTSEYTVAIAADGVGGVVTVSPTVSTLYTITVYRETTRKQESDYDDYNQFPADTLETDLDKELMISQELGESIDRCLILPISVSASVSSELPSPEATKVIGWSVGGLRLCNYDNAATSATAAASSATAALASQSAAASSATAAGSHATTALTNANLSLTYANTASTYALTASTHATTAMNAATTATSTLSVAINLQTRSYTLILTDTNKMIDLNSAGTIYLTIPSSGSVNFTTGSVIALRQLGAGQAVITTSATVTLNREVGLKITGQYGVASILKTGTDEWQAFGALEA
jgi:hypothetical protein